MTAIDWRPELWRADGQLSDGTYWAGHVGRFGDWAGYLHYSDGPVLDANFPTEAEAKAAVVARVAELERAALPAGGKVRHITDPDSLETGMA